ncbi:hypothetical protein CLV67_118219 [Actinoplanes italicus]|uniref:Uncharacterized protein n=1 Tax=Actinoplanes italicus TaxID=113567 RepID=A0A2T0K284_9ACTN|nr:hypothetical protein CLV67_118219 [Actinoplanes italicus]
MTGVRPVPVGAGQRGGRDDPLRRLTLIVSDGAIEHVFHPISEPASHAAQVVDWLRGRRREDQWAIGQPPVSLPRNAFGS